MNEEEIKQIIEIILNLIRYKKVTWRLEGSANLLIHGVNVSVRDLDITADNNGLKLFRELLNKFVIKDFFNNKIDGNSLVCDINGFEVEINCYGDRELNMFDKTKIITWKGLEVPIIPLEYARLFYERINSGDKVEIIKRHLGKLK